MVCIKCSADIPENSIFCNLCGKKQQQPAHGTKKRGNGQGSVYKAACGTWTAEITLGYYVRDGVKRRKRRRKYGFEKKKDAVAYLLALQNGTEAAIRQVTMSELWELFKANHYDTLSKSKQTAYNIAWKKICKDIDYKTIDEFTVPDLQEIVDTCGSSYYTKRDIKNLLSHFYKLAIRDDYVDKNKAVYIQLPQHQSEERVVFAKSETAILWDDYRTAPSAITACMLIMLYTGMRPGEILTVEKKNINLQEQYLTGGIKTKKGKNRKIIIPDKLLPLVADLMETTAGERLVPYRIDNDFYDDWKEKRQALALREQLTPYCCRHTYVTRLTSLKVSPAMLQELAGHEDYDTTLEYTHLSVAERLAEVNRLD